MNDIASDRPPAPSLQQAHSPRYVWYAIILLTIVNVFNYMDRMALSVLLPFIKADLTLSDAQLGLLTGVAFSLFYAVCGLPIARWADRGVRRNIIAYALTVWSLMTAISGAAQNFWHLFGARVGVGAGEAGCLPPAQSLLCDHVPTKRRSGVFAVHTFGLYAGMMVGMSLAGWLGEIIGWRWTFVALGLPGIALALVVRFTLREPQRGFFDAAGDDKRVLGIVPTLQVLWQRKTYRMITLLMVTNGFAQYGLNQWWPTYYNRTFEFSLSTIGPSLGIAIGVGSAIGILAGGFLANTAGQRNVRLPLFIGAVATLLATPAALGTLWISSTEGLILTVGLTAICWSVSNGPAVAAAQSVVTSRMRATASAVSVFCTSVLGFGLGPFFVGLLSDLLAPTLGVQSLRYALLAPICLFPVMALVLYFAGKALPDDLKAIGSR